MRTGAATSGSQASKCWVNGMVMSEIGRLQIVGAAFVSAAVESGGGRADARDVAVESLQQRRFVVGRLGRQQLQGFGADEERRLHRLVMSPKMHRVARSVVMAAGVGKSDRHGRTMRASEPQRYGHDGFIFDRKIPPVRRYAPCGDAAIGLSMSRRYRPMSRRYRRETADMRLSFCAGRLLAFLPKRHVERTGVRGKTIHATLYFQV